MVLVRRGKASSTIQHQLTLLLLVDDGWLIGCYQCLLVRLLLMLIDATNLMFISWIRIRIVGAGELMFIGT